MTTSVTPTSSFVEVNGPRPHYLDCRNQGAPVMVCVKSALAPRARETARPGS